MKKEAFCDGWHFGREGESLRPVTIPHDAMQEAPRRPDAPSGRGGAYFVGEKYWYEKVFFAPDEWQNETLQVEFEGVSPRAEVYLNGQFIGSCAYAYTRFRVTLNGLLYHQENTLRVVADHSKVPNSRWYDGAGIYRPVWLLHIGINALPPDAVRVTTLFHEPAKLLVETKKQGLGQIKIEILDDGRTIANAHGERAIITIPHAKLWNAEHPYMYTCRVCLIDEDTILDKAEICFGIRTLSWNEKGLLVNGESIKLKGGCIHHDHGILGARTFTEAEYRRIQRMKAFGFNAVRSAHNPAAPALLKACDELGMYVMEEGWDTWTRKKNLYDYGNDFADHYEEDIMSMIEKDYNHPSVILYSIGNEITEPAQPEGIEWAKKLVDTFHRADPTRPVTGGINLTLILMAAAKRDLFQAEKQLKPDVDSTYFNQLAMEHSEKMLQMAATPEADQLCSPLLDLLDIAGYNYANSRYEMEGTLHPGRLLVGSETYTKDLAQNWALVEKLPYLIGDFMWAGWDYLGEAGVGSWNYEADGLSFRKPYPWILADVGAIDILGNDTAEAGMARAIWNREASPYIGVVPINREEEKLIRATWRCTNALPYWSYRGCQGRPARIEVYTGAAEVELFLNGKSLGRVRPEGCKAVFSTTYSPGELQAVAYRQDGSFHSSSTLRSATGCVTPQIRMEAIGCLIWLDISLRGENGEIECAEDRELAVSVEEGELLAFGSSNPRTEESFLTGRYTTWYGRSQAVVRKTTNLATIIVTDGNNQAKLTL